MYLSCHVQVSGEDGQSVSEVRVVSTSFKECLFGEGCFFHKALSSAKKRRYSVIREHVHNVQKMRYHTQYSCIMNRQIILNSPANKYYEQFTLLSAYLPPSC